MKVYPVKVYQYDELTESAKQKARYWYIEAAGNDDMEYVWEGIKEDAERIGLKMSEWDYCRTMNGELELPAIEVIQKIKKEHGESCDTYKTAIRYEASYPHAKDDEEKLMDWEHEFLHDLLEDYRRMAEAEWDYQTSRESVEEMLRINEYEFTADGRRFIMGGK